MNIRKAVITAAGRGARLYPAATPVQKSMLPIVDRDGFVKPAIQLIAEEALFSGAEDLCIVCAPGDEEQYIAQLRSLRENLLIAYEGADWAKLQAERLDDLLQRLSFRVQQEPLGYGHAVACARDFTGGEPFLLLLGDHLYLSKDPLRRCAEQITGLAKSENCAVAGVQVTRESLIRNYGTLAGRRLEQMQGVYQIERILEKPAISKAELELITPGLRTGHYLCFFGIHVLTPAIFDILESHMSGAADYALTPALNELARRERYLAHEVKGVRYDLGQKFGLLRAQLALGIAGERQDEVLASVLEVMIEARECASGRPEKDS